MSQPSDVMFDGLDLTKKSSRDIIDEQIEREQLFELVMASKSRNHISSSTSERFVPIGGWCVICVLFWCVERTKVLSIFLHDLACKCNSIRSVVELPH